MTAVTLTDEPAAAQPAAPEEVRSFPKRVLDVFFSPESAFRDFGPRAPWVWPFVLYMVVPLVLGFATPRLIPVEVRAAHLHEQMLANGAPDVPTLAELEVNMQEAESTPPKAGQLLVGMGIGSTIHAAYPAIVATLLLMIFTFALGGEARWRPYFAVVTHVLLIKLAFDVLVTVFVVATQRLSFNLQLHNLFPFVPQDSVVFRILAAHSVADVWMMAVLAAGVIQINRKGTWLSRFGIIVALQLAAVLAISFVFRLATGNLPGMGGAGG